MTWDPRQYERFRNERSQPFFDLLALVRPRPGLRAIDLGCGPGRLTRVLHERLQAESTLGIDSSPGMLAQAAAHAGPGLGFQQGDIADVAGGPYDLVFSNAALHWVADHEALLARLTRLLQPGGQIAVQVPANEAHPSHRVAAEVATEPPFREALGGHVRQSPVLAPASYAELLDRLGYAEQHVRLQVYGHHLAGPEEVVEWVKGTLLTDYQARLGEALFLAFLARYRERLLAVLGDVRPYFYTYPRILFWAQRA